MSGEAELFPTTGAPAQAGGAYQVLARRARPQTFADVVGQEHVTQTLVNAIRAGRVAHAALSLAPSLWRPRLPS